MRTKYNSCFFIFTVIYTNPHDHTLSLTSKITLILPILSHYLYPKLYNPSRPDDYPDDEYWQCCCWSSLLHTSYRFVTRGIWDGVEGHVSHGGLSPLLSSFSSNFSTDRNEFLYEYSSSHQRNFHFSYWR